MIAAAPVGVVLAGGAGSRMGEPKALVALAGRPLISYALRAVSGALDDVAVSSAPGVELPGMDEVAVWVQSSEDRHPLLGVVDALERAAGRAVVALPVDMPFVSSLTIAQLAAFDDRAGVVAARAGDDVQPLLARFSPQVAGVLADGARQGRPVHAVVASLDPEWLEVDPAELLNVNTPEDLAVAERRLGYPNVKE